MKARKKTAKSHPLFTIGYEQAKPAAVLDELKRAKIELLVDTRAVAASRRPGFSKRQLAASLDDVGIAISAPAEARHPGRRPRGRAQRRHRLAVAHLRQAHQNKPNRRKSSANWSR